MDVNEIIEKKKELESQIAELVNNFHKETEIPIEQIDVVYHCSYTIAREEYDRKYFTNVKLKNPFE